jgi:hypothetical protein
MANELSVYLGPYAEVKVKLVEGKEQPEHVDWYDLTDGTIALAHARNNPPDEGGYRRYRFFPNVSRPDEPKRQMHLAEPWVEQWEDWTELNIKTEICWFVKAFADEISLLKDTYAAVDIKWGYLQWCS